MREAQIENKVCKFAIERGWVEFKWSSPGNRGVPDRIFFRNGKTVAIEFKKENFKPSKQQKHILALLGSQGVKTAVVDSVRSGYRFFLDQGNKKENNYCNWKIDDYDAEFYRTSCDNLFLFSCNGIEENEFKFCPYCGGEIKEQKREVV